MMTVSQLILKVLEEEGGSAAKVYLALRVKTHVGNGACLRRQATYLSEQHEYRQGKIKYQEPKNIETAAIHGARSLMARSISSLRRSGKVTYDADMVYLTKTKSADKPAVHTPSLSIVVGQVFRKVGKHEFLARAILAAIAKCPMTVANIHQECKWAIDREEAIRHYRMTIKSRRTYRGTQVIYAKPTCNVNEQVEIGGRELVRSVVGGLYSNGFIVHVDRIWIGRKKLIRWGPANKTETISGHEELQRIKRMISTVTNTVENAILKEITERGPLTVRELAVIVGPLIPEDQAEYICTLAIQQHNSSVRVCGSREEKIAIGRRERVRRCVTHLKKKGLLQASGGASRDVHTPTKWGLVTAPVVTAPVGSTVNPSDSKSEDVGAIPTGRTN